LHKSGHTETRRKKSKSDKRGEEAGEEEFFPKTLLLLLLLSCFGEGGDSREWSVYESVLSTVYLIHFGWVYT